MKITLNLNENEILDVQNYFNFMNETAIQASIDSINSMDWLLGTPEHMNAERLCDVVGKIFHQIDRSVNK